MKKQWFYSHGAEKVVGPCSSAVIRKLAATGLLVPEDMIRSSRMPRAVKANRIKGLFTPPQP